jgi:hypothetical protein
VTVDVSKPGFGDFRTDASCEIRPQSLIGEYYVDCQPGKSPEHLKDGGTVPVEQTSSTIPVDLVNDIMRRPYRERFRLLITELGTGLAGRPDDLQEVLSARTRPPRDLTRAADPGQPERGHQELHHRLGHGRERAREEQEGRVRWVKEAGDTAEISATRRDELRASSSASRRSSTSCGRPWRASASWPTSRRRSWPTSSAPRRT